MIHIGPKCGKRASWIGASGDQTFFKLEESLVSEEEFHHSTVLASDHYFGTLSNVLFIDQQYLLTFIY